MAMPSKTPLELYDNTRVSGARVCLRKFYFRHVMDWEPITTKSALAFGGAWHKALDIIYPGLMSKEGKAATTKKTWNEYKDELVMSAMKNFLAEWTVEYGMPGIDDMETEQYQNLTPRTPTTAMEMLYDYIDSRKIFLTTGDTELVAVEEPFVVPLDPHNDSLFYVGRFDKVIRKGKDILGLEHKTTTAYSKTNGFRSSFIESFSPNSQIDGYLHAGYSKYGKQFKAVWVDAALVHKSETAFRWIPIERSTAQLDAWLWETRYWINQIQANRDALRNAKQGGPYLAAFPKNTSSCIAFESTCEYQYLCKSWSNPQGHATPDGYRVAKWEPFDELGLAKVFGKRRVK